VKTWNDLREMAARSRTLRVRAKRQLRESQVLLRRSYAALADQARRQSVSVLDVPRDDRDMPSPADEDGVEAPPTVEGEAKG